MCGCWTPEQGPRQHPPEVVVRTGCGAGCSAVRFLPSPSGLLGCCCFPTGSSFPGPTCIPLVRETFLEGVTLLNQPRSQVWPGHPRSEGLKARLSTFPHLWCSHLALFWKAAGRTMRGCSDPAGILDPCPAACYPRPARQRSLGDFVKVSVRV